LALDGRPHCSGFLLIVQSTKKPETWMKTAVSVWAKPVSGLTHLPQGLKDYASRGAAFAVIE
jgi:hypothetical protein